MRLLFEKIQLDQRASFLVREFRLPAFDSPLHVHPELELTYILSGRGKRIVGDSVLDYEPGDLVLVGPNLPHCWHSDLKRHHPSEWAHSLVIQFDPTALGPAFWSLPELANAQKLIDASARGLLIAPSLIAPTADQMQDLLTLDGSRRLFALLALLDQLAHAPGHEPLASPGFQPFADNRDYDRINRVYQYVFANFTEEINLSQAAGLLHMSKPAFCGYFLRRTRRTFSDFVNEIRIGHACKLLMETDRSVADIAFASGYKNLSNFNRRFRELRQVSPLTYRQRVNTT